MSEIAVTDRTNEEVIKFAGKEKLRYNDIFSEQVAAFADPEFWGDYNVIEPDQSIESAITPSQQEAQVQRQGRIEIG